MTFSDGIMVAIFCMSVVFALLAAIYGLIRVTNAVIVRLTGRRSRAEHGKGR